MVAPRWGGATAQRLTAACLAHYGNVCHLCGRPGATTADHLIPRSRGGDNSLDNLRPAHSSCNSSRGAKPLNEWFKDNPMKKTRVRPSRKW